MAWGTATATSTKHTISESPDFLRTNAHEPQMILTLLLFVFLQRYFLAGEDTPKTCGGGTFGLFNIGGGVTQLAAKPEVEALAEAALLVT